MGPLTVISPAHVIARVYSHAHMCYIFPVILSENVNHQYLNFSSGSIRQLHMENIAQYGIYI